MGGIGRCCCTCECVLFSELPAISIGGMTGQGWQGSLCCFRQAFTFNATQTDSVITTAPIWTSSATQDRTQEVKTFVRPYQRMYSSPGPGDWCDDVDYESECCPERNVLMGTLREILQETLEYKLQVEYRRESVEVEYSKQKVDCDGSEVCRYVVKLSIFYSYDYVYLTERQSSRQVISTPAGGCFVVAGPDSNGKEASFTDESAGSTSSGSGFGTFRVDRIKYYDSAPTGTITFVTTDTDTCDRTNFTDPVCETEGNYVSQVCLTADLESPPCWCSGTTIGFEDDTWDNEGASGCSPYALIFGCEEVFCSFSADLCSEESVPCSTTVQCSAIQTAEGCSDPVFVLTGLDPSWVIGDQFFSFFPDCCISVGSTTVCSSYPFGPQSPCNDVPLGSGLECDEECCHSYIDFEESCPACNLFIISCEPKYGNPDRTITAHTLTTSCSGPTARSACIPTPSSFQIVLS
jgi:hypothetical protein